MLNAFHQRFTAWALRRQRYHQGTVTLSQRVIYILPTRQGLALAFLLVLMLLGDINYNLSLGYVLTFLLAMMAVMSMLHAFRNLAHLEVRAGSADPVFRGEIARFTFHFRNPGMLARYQLVLRHENGDTVAFDAPANQDTEVALPLAANERGWLQPGRITLYTDFPLGLFHAWTYLQFDTCCLVYPKPLEEAALPPGEAPEGTGKRSVAGDDDFAGLRGYVEGDALPRIAWKAYARERGLQVKQFSTQVGEELWLDFAAAPEPDTEGKLARIARWVLDAEAQGLRYGLKLPDGEVPPNSGSAQRDECLRRLALFGLPQQDNPLPQPLSRKRERGAKQAPRPLVGEGLGRGQ